MISPKLASDDAGVVSFVEIIFLETDRECLDRARTGTRHQRYYCGRIRSAAKKRAERHVGNEPDTRRLIQPAFQLFQTLFLALRRMRTELREVPVLADANLALFEFKEMSRRQFVDSGKSGDRVGDVAVIQIFEQPLRVHFGRVRERLQESI